MRETSISRPRNNMLLCVSSSVFFIIRRNIECIIWKWRNKYFFFSGIFFSTTFFVLYFYILFLSLSCFLSNSIKRRTCAGGWSTRCVWKLMNFFRSRFLISLFPGNNIFDDHIALSITGLSAYYWYLGFNVYFGIFESKKKRNIFWSLEDLVLMSYPKIWFKKCRKSVIKFHKFRIYLLVI